MEKLNQILSKRVGGVPVVAIFALFAGVVLFYAIRMKPVEEGEVSAEMGDEGEEVGGGDAADYSQPVFSVTPTITQPSGVGSGGGSVTAISMADSNDLWQKRVMTSLMSAGYSYEVTAGMLSKFLGGESLTVEEAKVRDLAIKEFGMPPDGVAFAATAASSPAASAPVVEAPAYVEEAVVPAYIPPPAPAAVKQGEPPLTHTVAGTNDNTAEELSILYYRYANKDTKVRIRAFNAGNEGPWSAGARVRIPKDKDPQYYTATARVNTLHEIAAKNGTEPARIKEFNPKLKFPVKAGTRVRVV